jgi:hypothetical protein
MTSGPLKPRARPWLGNEGIRSVRCAERLRGCVSAIFHSTVKDSVENEERFD